MRRTAKQQAEDGGQQPLATQGLDDESEESTPTSISTKRNNIRTAPV